MLRTPLAFLRFIAKAALNAAGFGVAVEGLPDMARDVWQRGGKDDTPCLEYEYASGAVSFPGRRGPYHPTRRRGPTGWKAMVCYE